MDENILDEAKQEHANSVPGEDTQEADMPSVEEKPTETDDNFGELPEEVSERTREQFEKLRQANNELAEKLRRLENSEYGESVFDYFQSNQVQGKKADTSVATAADYQHLNQRQVDNIVNNFVADDGTVDIQALNQALVNANKKAEQAVARSQAAVDRLRRSEEKRQVAEAHAKHPWLDPRSPDFDSEGYNLVRDRIVRNMWEGKEQSLAEVADSVTKFYKPRIDVSAEKKKAVEEYKETQAKKAQAGSVSASRAAPRDDASLDDLRKRTLAGDKSALDARLEALTS